MNEEQNSTRRSMRRAPQTRSGCAEYSACEAKGFLGGDLIPISQVPERLPSRRGKKVHISTIFRWASNGVGGVRLRTVRIGGARYTSDEELHQFIAQVSSARRLGNPLDSAEGKSRHVRDESTSQVLRSNGLEE